MINAEKYERCERELRFWSHQENLFTLEITNANRDSIRNIRNMIKLCQVKMAKAKNAMAKLI